MNERFVRDGRTRPDYLGLLRALEITKCLVDATGVVSLTTEEAAHLHTLGFPTATSGSWRVPAIPPQLVRDNWLFEHLSYEWPTSVAWPEEPAWAGDNPAGADPGDAIDDHPPEGEPVPAEPGPVVGVADTRGPVSAVEDTWAPAGLGRVDRTFISPVDPREPSPPRKQTNAERLAAARNRFGKIHLRIVFQARQVPDRPHLFSPLRGEAVTVHLRETGDVVELLHAVHRFVKHWRHARSELERQQRDRLLLEWERLSSEG